MHHVIDAARFLLTKIYNIYHYLYITQVSLKYPDNGKSWYSEFPPLCARRNVKKEEYGPFTTHTMEKLKFKPPPNQEKLISDLYPLEHHYIHYSILKQVLNLGLELVEVHRVVRYMYTKTIIQTPSSHFELSETIFLIHHPLTTPWHRLLGFSKPHGWPLISDSTMNRGGNQTISCQRTFSSFSIIGKKTHL